MVHVYADSDWGGDLQTPERKSTSGGVLVFGGGVVKSWATTQGSTALSVAEAELYAGVRGAAEAIGMVNVLRDLGIETKVTMWQDSSSAMAMESRTGMGKARHIDTRFYWVQDVVRRGIVTVRKIAGKFNPADLLTKPQNIHTIAKLPNRLNGAVYGR